MKKIVKSFLLLCSIFCFLLTGIQVFAAEKEITFHQVTLTKRDGSPIGNVDIWQELKFSLNFSIPNGAVSPGDTTTIQMNPELTFTQEVPIEIKKDNKTFANVRFNKQTNQITLTYTDEIVNFNDIEGSFFFLVRVENANVIGEQDVPVTLVSNGTTIYNGMIHYNGAPAATPFDIQKVGWKVGGEDKRSLDYRIDLNQKSLQIENAVLKDRFADDVNLNISNIIISKGTWVDAGDGTFKLDPSVDVSNQFTIHMDPDNKGFRIDLGTVLPTEGYRIRYRATTNYDPIQGEKITNTASLTGDNINVLPVTSVLTYNVGGSEVIGYQYKIKVVKTDQNGTVLPGAEFKLVRDATGLEIARLTTNNQGEILFDNLLKDAYTLTEVTAPAGYLLDATPIKVVVSDFNDQKLAVKTVLNKRADEKVKVVVKKKWLGKELDSATFKLLKDDQDTGKKLILTKAMGWEDSFENLLKYDPVDHHEYVYNVEEVVVDGYQNAILNPMPNEFDVLNYEVFDLEVTKEWVGPKQASATFKLFADGVDQGITITVDESTNWKSVFANLHKYDFVTHAEIRYTVQEVPIVGYTSVVQNNPNGVTVKNISQETKNISVKVNWIGAVSSHSILRLFADNQDTGQVIRVDNTTAWQGAFNNLLIYDQRDGHPIVYTVKQEPIFGYMTVIQPDATGFTVINTKIISKPSDVEEEVVSTPYKPSIPKTQDSSSTTLYQWLLLTTVVTLVVVLNYKQGYKVN
ncbi:MAG: Cna B-type domain-containing protein [Erysipelotrichaceae bacterium]|nr:Cna B-type domain-containing protein [Erysipelotrichaceae bacterium]